MNAQQAPPLYRSGRDYCAHLPVGRAARIGVESWSDRRKVNDVTSVRVNGKRISPPFPFLSRYPMRYQIFCPHATLFVLVGCRIVVTIRRLMLRRCARVSEYRDYRTDVFLPDVMCHFRFIFKCSGKTMGEYKKSGFSLCLLEVWSKMGIYSHISVCYLWYIFILHAS